MRFKALLAFRRESPRGGQKGFATYYPEGVTRRDEIVFAEKIRRNIRTWEYIDNFRKLVEEVIASLDPKAAERIRKRPRYIETVGEACPMSVTRITREPVEGESVSRDYEFSRKSIDQDHRLETLRLIPPSALYVFASGTSISLPFFTS
jgi:hypothetical protein